MAIFSVRERKRASVKEPKKDDYSIAVKFSKLVEKELGNFLKAIVLFGSCATNKTTSQSDIDILIIVDDIGRIVTPEVTEAYRLIILKCATSNRLHLNTLKLSHFWEYVRQGDPAVINMLRDGVILMDTGFFGPIQLLLDQGKIRPTKEAIWTYYARTSNTMRTARQHILSAAMDLYWAGMDASHAALMSVGEMPPSPEHVHELLEQVLVKKKLLAPQYPKIMRELYQLNKAILHRDIKELSGEQYDAYWQETLRLVDALRTVVERYPSGV